MSESGHGGKSGGLFAWLVHSPMAGSVALLAATVVALVWANSPWAEGYFELAHGYIGISWGDATFELSLQHWVNDFLMVVFFFVVGLEIKREIVSGALSSVQRAVLPVSAALGGMIVPAIFYLVLNQAGEAANGFGVPMATDIAFALGILALFGTRAPLHLKVFLTALAIADDIGAVLVIAGFYTEQIHLWPLLVGVGFILLIAAANRAKVRRIELYMLLVLGAWVGIFASGIHATIAGILVAMAIPVQARIAAPEFRERLTRRWSELEKTELTPVSMLYDQKQLYVLGDMLEALEDMIPAGIFLEHYLHPVQALVILPLFAFFNAGVAIGSDSLSWPLNPVTLGIIFGLFVGKQVGVVGFSWLAVRFVGASLPDGVSWAQVWGASCLAGVGFTMSLFVSELAFADPAMIAAAKIGILIASLISGVAGYLVLRKVLPR